MTTKQQQQHFSSLTLLSSCGFLALVVLEEVVGSTASDMWFASLWGRVELQERVIEGVVQFHDGSHVAAAVAIVGRRKDGHHIVIVAPIEALHHQLMGASDQSEAVGVIERLGNVMAKSVACATRRDAPATTIIRV